VVEAFHNTDAPCLKSMKLWLSMTSVRIGSSYEVTDLHEQALPLWQIHHLRLLLKSLFANREKWAGSFRCFQSWYESTGDGNQPTSDGPGPERVRLDFEVWKSI
jgi:hypothetical protein